jgi:hypothetical protein
MSRPLPDHNVDKGRRHGTVPCLRPPVYSKVDGDTLTLTKGDGTTTLFTRAE